MKRVGYGEYNIVDVKKSPPHPDDGRACLIQIGDRGAEYWECGTMEEIDKKYEEILKNLKSIRKPKWLKSTKWGDDFSYLFQIYKEKQASKKKKRSSKKSSKRSSNRSLKKISKRSKKQTSKRSKKR